MEKPDKIIYLDWNIFQDIKQNRNADELKSILNDAKRKNYVCPYSYAHIRDLSRCSNEDYLQEDLKFISEFCDNYCLFYNYEDGEKFYIENKNPKEVMDNLKKQCVATDINHNGFLFKSYKVDMSKIPKSNFLFSYLEKTGGIMSSDLFCYIVKDMYPAIFDNVQMQKNFKNSLQEIIHIKNPSFQCMLDFPLYKYFLDDKKVIIDNFSKIFNSFLALSGKNEQNIKFGKKITTASNMLDFFPAFSEKINKKNNINNIATDSEHLLFGTSAKYYITNDKKYNEKIEFLYKYFNVKTKVYMKEEFVKKVNFA